ncbi:MAG: hypothetical protein WBW62_03480 [Solirubrobacterales bacterium]
MIKVDGKSHDTLVLDGEWFEKLRHGQQRMRLPASTFVSVETDVFERRKKLFGGDKEQLIRTAFRFDAHLVGFVTEVENQAAVQEIIAGLEAARDS